MLASYMPTSLGIEPGQQAPFFQLPNANKNLDSDILSLTDIMGSNGAIITFTCNHCPYVVGSESRIEKIAAKARENNIGFIGINSNDPEVYPNDSFEHMQTRAEGMGYPYLHDATQDIAHAYGAKRTPEFFLFNSDGALVYQGRMDDSPKDPTKVTTQELSDAIEAMLSGSKPSVDQTESIGCSVKWKA